jgi:hypothetical protein
MNRPERFVMLFEQEEKRWATKYEQLRQPKLGKRIRTVLAKPHSKCAEQDREAGMCIEEPAVFGSAPDIPMKRPAGEKCEKRHEEQDGRDP